MSVFHPWLTHRHSISLAAEKETDDMTGAEMLRSILERGFNRGDLSVADELCSPDLVEHEYLVPPHLTGPDILKHQIFSARAEIANLAVELCDCVEAGDTVWGRSIAKGLDPKSGLSP